MPKVKFVNLGKQYLGLRQEILDKFDEISKNGDYILSKEVSEFEENFAMYCGTKYAAAVGNGSDALYLVLLSLGIGLNDEVITAPNSFVSTAGVIARAGARIVFCDVDDDMNIDPSLIESVISERTKAILPVHLTGRVADMDRIQTIADKYNLFVVEDAAQAVGAVYKNKKAGSFGIGAGFSLHPLKNLHVHGDGGIVTTDDLELYKKIIKYRNHGLQNRDECEFWGINTRLDSINAGIGNIKLRYLNEWNNRYRKIARMYTDNLNSYVKVPKERDYEKPVYHRYIIRHPDRNKLQAFLANSGIETKVNYPIPLHLQPAATGLGYKKGDFPITEQLANNILSLPLYPELEDDQVFYVIEKIIKFCKN